MIERMTIKTEATAIMIITMKEKKKTLITVTIG